MTLEELSKAVGFDWTMVSIWLDSYKNFEFEFPIEPKDYLRFAYQDLLNNDLHGRINAITNAKRACDCQVDTFLACIGYKTEDLPQNVIKYVNDRFLSENYEGITIKLKLLRALDIVPVFLISKLRKTRNDAEHEYIQFNKDEAKEAVEIAELFNAKLQYVLGIFGEKIFISNKSVEKRGIIFDFQTEGQCLVSGYRNSLELGEVVISKTDDQYLDLIRFNIAVGTNSNIEESLYEILKSINCKIPLDKISIHFDTPG